MAAASASAASMTPAAGTSAPTARASAALALRPGFINNERTSEKILVIQSRDSFLRFRVVANLGETKAARLPRETIAKQRESIRLHPDFRKQRLHLLFCSLKRKITYEQFLHGSAPCAHLNAGHAMRG